MSIFPTRILLATDGSENAAHATDVAAQLSEETGSELHVLYVGEDVYSATLVYPDAADPGGAEWDDPVLVGPLASATSIETQPAFSGNSTLSLSSWRAYSGLRSTKT